MQTPRTTAAFAQRPLYVPAELLLRCRRPFCAAMVTLRRPHCALIRTPCDGVCFEHAQSACRHSAFYAIPQRLLGMPLRCCGDACDRTVSTSAFCMFLGRRENAALVWQGFKSLQTNVNSLPNDNILDWSKLKTYADDKIIVTEKFKFVFGRAENIVGKGENAGYQHFFSFSYIVFLPFIFFVQGH